MKKGFTLTEILVVLGIGGIIFAIIGACLFAPYMEMQTFNKFSKTKATLFDAVFADLRVIPN